MSPCLVFGGTGPSDTPYSVVLVDARVGKNKAMSFGPKLASPPVGRRPALIELSYQATQLCPALYPT